MSEELTVQIEINDENGDLPVDADLIERVVTYVLREQGQTGAWELGIRLTDDAELQTLNAQFRGIDAPTDVLSFGNYDDDDGDFVGPDAIYEDDFADPEAAEEAQYLGDLAISAQRVRAQAAEFGHSTRRELCYLIAHGTLHLLGYDHETDEEREAMRQREEAAMTALGITREAEPYAE
jgi:probable rRNA maturation factor